MALVRRDSTPPEEPTREGTRYEFAVPMELELHRGFLRSPDRAPSFLVDLSTGGAAIVTRADSRLKLKKRYRVWIDGYAGIIEVRNVTDLGQDRVRLGVAFSRLGLELQELIVDSVNGAKAKSTKLT